MLLLVSISLTATAQNKKFDITFSYGLAAGSRPTTTGIPAEQAITRQAAERIIRFFTDSTKIDFKCIYNGCQNRAAIMSLYLNKRGIRHYKIWNFDPFKISIFNRQDALDVNDVLNLKPGKIFWDFHVAVAVLVNNGKQKTPDTLVIDPSFSAALLTVTDWLNLQNSPNSYYTFLDPIWYNFVTLQPELPFPCGDNTDTLKISNCFPFLITGDFYRYDQDKEFLAAQEMAVNETTTYMATDKIYKLQAADPLRNSLAKAVSDFNGFMKFLQSSNAPEPGNPLFKYAEECRKLYASSLAYWTRELKSLAQ